MERRRHGFTPNWLVSLGAIVVIAGHGIILYYGLSIGLSLLSLPIAVVLGAIILKVLTHLGVFAPLFARLRRHSRN